MAVWGTHRARVYTYMSICTYFYLVVPYLTPEPIEGGGHGGDAHAARQQKEAGVGVERGEGERAVGALQLDGEEGRLGLLWFVVLCLGREEIGFEGVFGLWCLP